MNKMRIETWLTGKCLDKHEFLRMAFSDVAVYFADSAPKLTIYDQPIVIKWMRWPWMESHACRTKVENSLIELIFVSFSVKIGKINIATCTLDRLVVWLKLLSNWNGCCDLLLFANLLVDLMLEICCDIMFDTCS